MAIYTVTSQIVEIGNTGSYIITNSVSAGSTGTGTSSDPLIVTEQDSVKFLTGSGSEAQVSYTLFNSAFWDNNSNLYLEANQSVTKTVKDSVSDNLVDQITLSGFSVSNKIFYIKADNPPDDTIPDSFSFPSETGKEPNTYYTSAETITGITAPTLVSIGSTGSESHTAGSVDAAQILCSVAGGTYTTANQYVENGETVAFRIKTGSSYDQMYHGDIRIGGVLKTYYVTTRSVDHTPTNFGFSSSYTNEEPSSSFSSSTTVNGMEAGTPVSISASSSPSVSFSVGGGSNRTSPTTMNPGQSLTANVATGSAFDEDYWVDITVGTLTRRFNVHTRDPNLNPNFYSIGGDISNAEIGYVYESSPVTISGVEAPVSVGSSNGSHKIGNGSWSAENTITSNVPNGSIVYFRMTSSNVQGQSKTGSLSIGSGSNDYASRTITTKTLDATPTFSLGSNVSNANTGTYYYSNNALISGMDSEATAYATITSNGSYRINSSGLWYTSSSSAQPIQQGDYVQVRISSSSSFSSTKSATLTIGGVSDSWSVTTKAQDTYPDSLNFADATGVELSTEVIRYDTVTGINTSVLAEAGGYGSVSLNGVNFYSSVTITNNSTIYLKVVSDPAYGTLRTGSVSIGGRTGTLNVTTKSASVIMFPYTSPDIFGFSDVKTFFNGSNILSAYYRGGSYVPDIPENSHIPTSSVGLELTDFYGSAKL